MEPDPLDSYKERFSRLNRKVSHEHGPAPHKPVLLLAMLDEIERGAYRENLIRPTPDLVAAFRAYWEALVESEYWQPRVDHPFRYLHRDGFWTFVRGGELVTPEDRPYSLLKVSAEFDGVRLAPKLWTLLQDRAAVRELRAHLLQAVFGRARVARKENRAVLSCEIARLKAEAQSRFQPRRVREKDNDGYFVRHTLFPRVVRGLYGGACAVCSLSTGTDDGSGIVDGAHIMPFADFHNDDPRNGIALCKNHYWGFDAGWFSISRKYRVLVSDRLRDGLGYVTAGVTIRLPQESQYAPAADALEWHRKRWRFD